MADHKLGRSVPMFIRKGGPTNSRSNANGVLRTHRNPYRPTTSIASVQKLIVISRPIVESARFWERPGTWRPRFDAWRNRGPGRRRNCRRIRHGEGNGQPVHPRRSRQADGDQERHGNIDACLSPASRTGGEAGWAGYHKFTAPDIEPIPGDRLRARITLPSGEELELVALFSK